MARPAATVDLSVLIAMARTGCTVAGIEVNTTFGRSVNVVVGGLAPWSIQSLIVASSCGVSGSSSLGGMNGFCVLPTDLNSRLSTDLFGTITGPLALPFIRVA